MIASTAEDGINIFRPNFNPVDESEPSSGDEHAIKEETHSAEEDN